MAISMALSSTILVSLLLPNVVLPNSAYKRVVVLVSSEDHALAATLSALQYAAEAINRDPSILPMSPIELVTVDAGGCGGQNDEYGSLVEFVSDTETSGEVIGVVGPFCGLYPRTIGLLSRTIENFGVLQISGSVLHHQVTSNVPLSLISLACVNFLMSSMFRIMDHIGWHRIGLISSIEQDSVEKLLEISNQSPVNIVSTHVMSSEYSIASILQDIQEIDVTIFLLSMPLNRVYQVICHVYKYQRHLMWPKYVWIVYGHWYEDILSEQRVTHSPKCTPKEVEYAVEGLILFNLHLEPKDVNDIIVTGQTYQEYTTSITSSIASERFRSNLGFDSLWALALVANSTTESTNRTLISYRPAHLDFSGVSGRGNHTRVDIAWVSDGIHTSIGYYSIERLYINTTLFDFVPTDSLPRVQVQVASWVEYLFISVTVAIEIYAGALIILYFYFRKEPEVKATSPYLNLIAFAGIYMVLTGVQLMMATLSGREEYVSVPLCVLTIWFISHGDALYVITLLVRLVRIYRVFSHFGRTGRIWSDMVLVVAIVGLMLLVTINATLWTVFYTPAPVTQEIVDNGTVFADTFCDYQLNISLYICLVYSFILRLLLVVFSVLTRNIRRKHFKDTKKINLFIFLNVLLGFLFLLSPIIFRINVLRAALDTVILLILVLLYMTLLILPKVWPPLLRKTRTHTCLKYHNTNVPRLKKLDK